MQIILIETNPVLRDLLAINIKTYLGIDVIVRENTVEAIELLTILPEIDLIIVSARNGMALEMAKYVIANNLTETTPIMTLGDLPQLDGIEEFAISASEDNWEMIIEKCAKVLGITNEILANLKKPEYEAIPINYFLNLESTCCDIFIRIKKKENDFQFIKRFHKDELISSESIKKYRAQGLKNFYVLKDEIQNFTTFVSNKLYLKLYKINDLSTPLEERLDLMSASYDFATKEILKKGFTTSTVQLTEKLVSHIVQSANNNMKMSSLLMKVLNSKTGHIYQHAHLTSVVACEILKNLDLKQKGHSERMTYAALFKDISLADNEELSKINSPQKLEEANLSEEEWEKVFNHALEGAILVREHPDAPIGVDNIIKHHHGSYQGRGFQIIGEDEELDLHSLIFIVACEFVDELLAIREEGKAPRPLIDDLLRKYQSDFAKQVINALAKTINRAQSSAA